MRKAQVFDVGHVPAAAPGRAPAPGQGPGLGSLVALAVTSVLQLALQRQSSGRPLRVGRTPAVSPLPRELTPAVAVVAPTACPPSLDRYDLLVHHTNEIVYFIDDRNRIVEASAAAARAYGYTADDLLKLDIADLQPRDTRAAVKNAVERARAHETVVFGTKQRRIDGTEFPVEITLTSQRGDGAASEILAIVRDTTQHQAVEDSLTTAYDNAVDAARLKTAFVAAMSHEIRTPMNTILGMGELMLDTDLTNDQRGFSEAVRESGQALLSIIDDVLDFSQIESGGPEFEMEDVDVSAILESAVAAFASRAAKAGLSLTVRFDPRIVGAIRADASRLRRTLVHLIDNAVKFTESGGIVISATLEEGDEWTSTIRFAVEDTGSGIDETAAKVIFEAFRQADVSPTRRHAGAGLGLTIARRFIG
ncbi:MAG: PAS domain S-box protein [Candidatus Eremiobacteraeota bacterium]|nr:PAS domain S-box protein [Candidatus Eremiobacteraeota bacterium]